MFKYYLPQQKVLRKTSEKVFINKKFIQSKTSLNLKIGVFQISDKTKILQSYFQNMNCFSWNSYKTEFIPEVI